MDLEPFWPVSIRRELENFATRRATNASRSDLSAYLDEIIRIANVEQDEGIIKFAIRKMDDLKLWVIYWESLEPFLTRVAVNFPHCLDYVARVVAWRHRRFGTDEEKWSTVCNSTIAYHAPLGNDSEVVWSCWLLKEIGGKLPARSCEPIIARCGPFSNILALDLHSSDGISGRFPKKSIYDRIDDTPMLGNDWLLSYEAERAFGFRLKGKNRNDYGVFGTLIDNEVQFYDSSAEPFVFQGVDDYETVDEALEDRIGLYEDDEIEDDDLDDRFFLDDVF